ncbi:PAS domain-containing protein [Clostridiaceae bacterium UIB06]|uniref:PAS domain-containing protein n=1 Tax=Clostridium thailandense TaxID=2794346 RepID=A0A949TYK2_9CLOT|nr:PAS domain-containing protein [Clostridium thailandense]MBV7272894.1 PAS domain-containing protein [Clostridium thailandense]MCH5136296.1 PAS domain-containing protein [Clostridiaceae bacterium UIB06]
MNYTMYLALIQGNLKILPSMLVMFFIIYLFFRIYSKFDISKYKEFEAKIQQKYDELEAVYGELAAMGETLEEQYSELLNNQQKLQESEEKYKFVTEVSKIEDLYKFIYDGDLERYHLSVKEYLSKKDSHYECEFRIKAKKGNCKWILES